MTPNFIIIGAQKSASSFMQVCLSDHPDIYMPCGESSCFETPDYESGDFKHLCHELSYRREKLKGIKRPNCIGKSEVAPRILKHCPEAKIIAVLRDPIERAVSSYFHRVNYGFMPAIEPEEGFDRLLHDPEFTRRYPRSKEILEFGLYYKYLKEYEWFRESSKMLIYLHEDILKDPLECVQKCYNFLGVDDSYVPKTLTSRPQKVTYSIKRLKLLRMRNAFRYDYLFGGMRLRRKQPKVLGRIFCRSIEAIDKYVLANIISSKKPRLSESLIQELRMYYADDLRLLERYLERDLSAWR